MNITVEVTANHMGYFTFTMCPVREQNQDPDQECFDRPEHLQRVLTTVAYALDVHVHVIALNLENVELRALPSTRPEVWEVSDQCAAASPCSV